MPPETSRRRRHKSRFFLRFYFTFKPQHEKEKSLSNKYQE